MDSTDTKTVERWPIKICRIDVMNIVLLLACNNDSILLKPDERPNETSEWEVMLTGNIGGEYEPCG